MSSTLCSGVLSFPRCAIIWLRHSGQITISFGQLSVSSCVRLLQITFPALKLTLNQICALQPQCNVPENCLMWPLKVKSTGSNWLWTCALSNYTHFWITCSKVIFIFFSVVFSPLGIFMLVPGIGRHTPCRLQAKKNSFTFLTFSYYQWIIFILLIKEFWFLPLIPYASATKTGYLCNFPLNSVVVIFNLICSHSHSGIWQHSTAAAASSFHSHLCRRWLCSKSLRPTTRVLGLNLAVSY